MNEQQTDDMRTSSVELKQSAKGDWYVGTLKIYFDKDTESNEEVVARITDLKTKVEQEILNK